MSAGEGRGRAPLAGSTPAAAGVTGRGPTPAAVGLFGGSFDPVHVGHLHAARAARAAFGLERVLFVPAAQPPHKPGVELAPAAHRLAMLRLAVAGEPGFEVCDLELSRPGPSYTIDTVRALEAELGGPDAIALHMILGSDNLEGLADWREVRELLARVQPVVVHRGGPLDARLAQLAERLPEELVARVARGVLRLPPVPVAARSLRARLARGEDVGAELPPAVAEYVRAHGLYRSR